MTPRNVPRVLSRDSSVRLTSRNLCCKMRLGRIGSQQVVQGSVRSALLWVLQYETCLGLDASTTKIHAPRHGNRLCDAREFARSRRAMFGPVRAVLYVVAASHQRGPGVLPGLLRKEPIAGGVVKPPSG